MSAIGGILRFDGGAIERPWLQKLSALLARRGPDGELIAIESRVGLVYRAYGTGGIEKAQSSLWNGRDGTLLAFDGRLDNGPDLARSLGLQGRDAQADSAILLEGLQRFGQTFAGQIIGDFALAHWSPATQQLTLARDPLGTRTLYFHHTPQWCAFASDLGALLQAASVNRTLDEEHIAAFLRGRHDERNTIYREIKPVRAGHALTVQLSGQVSDTRAWSLPIDPPLIVYKHDRDYEEHFRLLFEEAVRVRMRTSYPVIGELSGGLDSSSVVCMADAVLRAGASAAPSFSTMSYVQNESTTSDEGPFRKAVEDQCGREAFHVRESDLPVFASPSHVGSMHVLSTLTVSAAAEEAVCQHMRQVNAHVILTGDGGDEMFWASSLPYERLADLLVTGSLREFYRELRIWSPAIKQPYARVLAQTLTVALGRDPHRKLDQLPSWIHPRMRERVAAIGDPRKRMVTNYRLPTQRKHALGYYSNARVIGLGMRQDFDARLRTFPCLHRPLAEFLLAVPFRQKVRLGENRSLQRRALRDILPAVILRRRGKGDATEFHERQFRRGGEVLKSWLADSWAEACGYIDGGEVARILRTRTGGPLDKPLPVRPLALEVWLRAHHGASMGRQDSHTATIEPVDVAC
jgi:asparagine synthase (glutamine-hydrolysing)